LSTAEDVAYLHLSDILGRALISNHSAEITAGMTLIPLDISNLTPGTYILQVTTKSGALIGDYKVVKK